MRLMFLYRGPPRGDKQVTTRRTGRRYHPGPSRQRSAPMKLNTAKQKLLRGEPAFGYSLAFPAPTVAEALAGTGIDFVMVDTQHGSFGQDATIACLLAITTGSAVPMARVARNDYNLIGLLLHDGALGIVVPMVDTAEDAKRAADACRFPPVGTRSWGWGRAARYGDD